MFLSMVVFIFIAANAFAEDPRWEGTLKDANKPFNYCGIKITKILTDINVVGASGAISQLLGSCLKDNPILLTQPIVNPDDDTKEEIVIYPLNELNLKR